MNPVVRRSIQYGLLLFLATVVVVFVLYWWIYGVGLIADRFTPITEVDADGDPLISGGRFLVYLFCIGAPLLCAFFGAVIAVNTQHVWMAKEREKRDAKNKDTTHGI